MWKSFSSLGLAMWLILAAGQEAESRPAAQAQTAEQRTTITAEKMTVRNKENKAIFEGSVVLTKGAMVVHADLMVVEFKPGESQSGGGSSQGGGRVKRRNGEASEKSGPSNGALPTTGNRSVRMIEATGHVRIQKDDGQATSQKALYFADEEKMVLTGEPVAWQKGARVTGQKITMYLAEDRSVVEGNSRVQIEQELAGGR